MSAGTIALRLVIGGDSKGAQAALKGLGTAGGRAGKALKVAQTGAAIGLTAIVGIAGKGVQSYETLVKSAAALQRQSKISAEDASLLTGQWQRYGVAAEAGGKGVMMLSKQIDAANTGTQTSIDSFARLGITLNDLKTMSPYQVLEQVRSTLSQLPPSAERTSLSAKLLGRGFMSMSKWIAASSTDLDALNQQLKDSGQVMDEKELARAKDDLKQMALLQVDLRGLFVEVGRSAMPILRDLVPEAKKLLAVVKPLAPHLVEIGGALAAFLVVSKVATGFGTLVTVLSKVKALLVGGKIASGLAGLAGAGGFVKSGGKTVAQSLIPGAGGGLAGGAADATLKGAIALNTTATEANTLALGGKGIPGTGGVPGAAPAAGGGLLSKLKGPFSWTGLLGMAGMSAGGAGVEVQTLPPEMAAQFHAKGEQAGKAFAGGVNAGGADIARSLRASGDKAGAGLAAGLARGVGPALQSIGRVHSGAAKPIRTGRLDTSGWTGPLSTAAAALASFRDMAAAGITPGSMSQHAPRRPPPAPDWHAPGRARGAYVRRSPGGTLLRVGEGRYDEVVAQVLPGKGGQNAGGGDTIFNLYVDKIVGTDERAARQFWNLVKPIAMSDMRMKMAMSRG